MMAVEGATVQMGRQHGVARRALEGNAARVPISTKQVKKAGRMGWLGQSEHVRQRPTLPKPVAHFAESSYGVSGAF